MGIHKCNIGLIWSLLLAVCLTVIPRYWELKVESIPVLNTPILPPPVKPEVVEDTIQKNRTLVATLVDYDVPIESRDVVSIRGGIVGRGVSADELGKLGVRPGLERLVRGLLCRHRLYVREVILLRKLRHCGSPA